MPELIPKKVIDAYVNRFPHLRYLGNRVSEPPYARQAALAFARVACRLEAPTGVTAREIYALAGVAEGIPWREPSS